MLVGLGKAFGLCRSATRSQRAAISSRFAGRRVFSVRSNLGDNVEIDQGAEIVFASFGQFHPPTVSIYINLIYLTVVECP
jgi:hypothetical protein